MAKGLSRQNKKRDPIYVLFEYHLCHFPNFNMDRTEFVERVVKDYFKLLNQKKLTIPSKWQESMSQEITAQVEAMFIKKLYGILEFSEFKNTLSADQIQYSKAEYFKLKQSA